MAGLLDKAKEAVKKLTAPKEVPPPQEGSRHEKVLGGKNPNNIKPSEYKKGGAIDGCAQRGKTRGRVV